MEQFFCIELSEEIKGKLNEVIERIGISPGLLQLLLFIYQKEMKKEIAMIICEKFEEIDGVHQKYWNFRKKKCTGDNICRTVEDREFCKKISCTFKPSAMWIYYNRINH